MLDVERGGLSTTSCVKHVCLGEMIGENGETCAMHVIEETGGPCVLNSAPTTFPK